MGNQGGFCQEGGYRCWAVLKNRCLLWPPASGLCNQSQRTTGCFPVVHGYGHGHQGVQLRGSQGPRERGSWLVDLAYLESRFWALQLCGNLCSPRDCEAGWPPYPKLVCLCGAVRPVQSVIGQTSTAGGGTEPRAEGPGKSSLLSSRVGVGWGCSWRWGWGVSKCSGP